MIKGGKGGGNTRTGLIFEGKTDLSVFLKHQPHYDVINHDVFYDGEKVADIKTYYSKEDLKDGKLVRKGKKSYMKVIYG